MKHLPNLLTLCNLFSGCLAIVYILNVQPYWTESGNGQTYWVYSTTQPYLGSILILTAAAFDMFDGMAARWLRVFSPIGKDLDSLADLVSFGVAPALIIYKMLWAAWMSAPDALDISMLAMAPALLVACFAALRLATFNKKSASDDDSFAGMPTPAVGLFIAGLPLMNWFNPHGLGTAIQGKWPLYCVVAICCWLMVSPIRFFKLLPSQVSLSGAWRQIMLVVLTALSIPFLGPGAIAVAFVLYILLSLFRHLGPALAANHPH